MTDDKKVIVDPEEALDAGYYGWVPDETPNDAYTVAGVTSSDEAAKADRRAAAGLTLAPNPAAEAVATETKTSSKKKSS